MILPVGPIIAYNDSIPQSHPILAVASTSIPTVPFYSQFSDISSATWKKQGCGIASLAMVINYYKPKIVSVNTLLSQGISAKAYDYSAGWIYSGLIGLSKKYGLQGSSYDENSSSSSVALASLKEYLKDGPVIVSVHYKFDPKSTIPHLVVINAIKNNTVYYNDPAAKSGNLKISADDFLKGWKKRFIVIRPQASSLALAN